MPATNSSNAKQLEANSGSTIVLVTSDNERISVDKKKLSAQSQVFEDMFDIPTDGSNEVPVAESKEVVEVLLVYCGQARVPPFDLDHPLAWKLIKAFDKYDIGRGVDVEAAVELASYKGPGMVSRTSLIVGYFFSLKFAPEDVDKVVRAVIRLDNAQLDRFKAEMRTFTEAEGVSDHDKLVSRSPLLTEAGGS